MIGRPNLALTILAALLGVVIVVASNLCPGATQSDLVYRQATRVRDPERRQERLADASQDKVIDTSAFTGMPQSYTQAASDYLQAALAAVEVSPITRRRYYHKERAFDPADKTPAEPYPDSVNPVFDREAIVPIMILPRPVSVGKWVASSEALASGWRTKDQVIQHRGSVYGRTLIFAPGKLSQNPNSLPASPFETGIPSWDMYAMDYAGPYFLQLGKLVLTPHHDYKNNNVLTDRSAPLHLGEEGGAHLLGELITVPAYLANHRLFWTSIQTGTEARHFLAYSILDGNGPIRPVAPGELTTAGLSPYLRPLTCKEHQPKIKRHDELLLPAPLGWPPTQAASRGLKIEVNAHESWCLDDWFPAQKNSCWVVREANDSQPLQESFVLMPATEKSDQPVFLVTLFAETEPRQLLMELAALYDVSGDGALNSMGTMDRLDSLYDTIRSFPLGQ